VLLLMQTCIFPPIMQGVQRKINNCFKRPLSFAMEIIIYCE